MSACSRRNSSCSWLRTIGSTALNGSSISRNGGSVAERARHPDPLLLTAGQLPRIPAGELRVQPDALQEFHCRRTGFLLAAAEQARQGGHVVDDGAVRETGRRSG